MRFNEQFIKSVLLDASIISGVVPEDPHFVIDSRLVKRGDIFVALEGAKHDGHNYIKQAVSNGASGLMIQANKKHVLNAFDADVLNTLFVMIVSHTLDSLTALAKGWRNSFTIPIAAITGSVGKTSTKELVGAILKANGSNYLISEGNFNTKIGLSISILRLRSHHQVAVFEMGINKRGEMKELASILKPTTALITGIGHAHMEGLGSLQDIALEKRDIFSSFNEQSIGIINGDQSVLSQVSYQHPVIKFGAKTTNQIQSRKVRIAGSHISFVLKIYKNKYQITLKNPHAGSVVNTLAAAALAHQLGISDEVIVHAVQQPFMVSGRFEQRLMTKARGTLINDCYNANPESMKASLMAFQQFETKSQKIAVLGDMLELGVNGPFWHRQLGRFLRKVPSLKRVILVGSMVEWAKKTAPAGLDVELVKDWAAAKETLSAHLKEHDSVVLIKGSHGMKLGNLVEDLTGAQ